MAALAGNKKTLGLSCCGTQFVGIPERCKPLLHENQGTLGFYQERKAVIIALQSFANGWWSRGLLGLQNAHTPPTCFKLKLFWCWGAKATGSPSASPHKSRDRHQLPCPQVNHVTLPQQDPHVLLRRYGLGSHGHHDWTQVLVHGVEVKVLLQHKTVVSMKLYIGWKPCRS